MGVDRVESRKAVETAIDMAKVAPRAGLWQRPTDIPTWAKLIRLSGQEAVMDAIERLEAWRHEHKSRSCRIDFPDGYGADCISVDLQWGPRSKRHTVMAAEGGTLLLDGHYEPEWHDPDRDDLPGLAATIHAALDAAEKLEK